MKTLRFGAINLGEKVVQRLNLILAALYVLQSILLLLLAQNVLMPVFSSFLSVDSIQSITTENRVMAPAMKQLYDVNLTYLVVATLFIGAAALASQATWWKPTYLSSLKNRYNRLRWISYGLAVGLLFVVLGLLVGIYDVGSLITIFSLVVLSELAFGGAELMASKAGTKRASWVFFSFGIVAGLVAWLLILISMASHVLYATGAFDMYVYWLAGGMLLIGLYFTWLLYSYLRNPLASGAYVGREAVYMIASFISISALAWIIASGALL